MRGELLGERYRLVRQLGEGAMGQVWEALDESLGRPVAVKLISLLAGGGSLGTEARARFLREARITARLQHPNIVTIHDFGETVTTDGTAPFLVMELVRGEGLDGKLRRGGTTLRDAALWGAQICDALAEAHEAGIMHRDIKPSNIFITPSGIVKVLDFGIARAADPYATADRLTQTGFIVGTPPYMAPEQARGFPEPRSDLYALGCLLFEMVTGSLPFRAPDTVGYLTAHLTQEPPAPSSVSAARVAVTGMPETYRARHALRDTGLALGLPPATVDRIAKSFPHIRAADIRGALAELPELRGLAAEAETFGPLWELAEGLDKLPRGIAMHPCGVILSNSALLNRLPVQPTPGGEYPMVQADKEDVDSLGVEGVAVESVSR